ncbi:hypothetical protein FOCC_FOCC000772 [Frankliniella occidentalis]|nr:hypothetical protein FOCC_FOCC000772 [Frankliniella occidentalis]
MSVADGGVFPLIPSSLPRRKRVPGGLDVVPGGGSLRQHARQLPLHRLDHDHPEADAAAGQDDAAGRDALDKQAVRAAAPVRPMSGGIPLERGGEALPGCVGGWCGCLLDKQICLEWILIFTFCRVHARVCPPATDVDECADAKLHICNNVTELCINEPGGYRCVKRDSPAPLSASPPAVPARPLGAGRCDPGYMYSFHNQKCVDEDECIRNPCDSNQVCHNTVGSYSCECKEGFARDPLTTACVDINECQLGINHCAASQRCDNTIGSYQCIRYSGCGTGYTLNAATGTCDDDDECELGTDNCRESGPTWVCRNTQGSFRCERKQCEPDYQLLPSGECVRIDCDPGYAPAANTSKCVDIDECSIGSPCGRGRRCVNTPGSYQCVFRIQCRPGFVPSPEGDRCVDEDECATGTHNCKPGQTCFNRPGTYQCQCPPGHTLDETKNCVDACSDLATCENTVGSYRCHCKEGYRQGRGKSCDDIDECAETPNLCQQQCINVWGSYRCSCERGFYLHTDNRTCIDIDECQVHKDRHLCVGDCLNTLGSYRCHCPSGYRLSKDGRNCVDIDECATGEKCRQPGEICINMQGSFRCNTIRCPEGYVNDNSQKNNTQCRRGSNAALADKRCSVDVAEHGEAYKDCCEACKLGMISGSLWQSCELKRFSFGLPWDAAFHECCAAASGTSSAATPPTSSNELLPAPAANETLCSTMGRDLCAHVCKEENPCTHICRDTGLAVECSCRPGYALQSDRKTCKEALDNALAPVGPGPQPGPGCPAGYQFNAQLAVCDDVDECASGLADCGRPEDCVNTVGSYRCDGSAQGACPPGYVWEEAAQRCVDQDECEDGSNNCAEETQFCLNSQGGFACLERPQLMTFNFMTLVSNMSIPASGALDLFVMRGALTADTHTLFSLDLDSARAPVGVPAATRANFKLSQVRDNQAVVALVRPLAGPQDVELRLVMEVYSGSFLAGLNVAKLFLFVSEHPY